MEAVTFPFQKEEPQEPAPLQVQWNLAPEKALTIRTDIQALRAISVISVVIFHAFNSILPGGFVGVDIFFVISGFVITQTILKDIDNKRFSIADFYRRRIRRIFPALSVVLIFCLIAGWFFESPANYKELGKTTAATAFFVSNFAFWRSSGYFDGASEVKPLLHTWSLAVEEQFYIIYPILIFGITQYNRKSASLYLAILLLLSLALSQVLIGISPSASFYLAPSRGFELLIGAIVAAGGFKFIDMARYRAVISAVGLGLILSSLFFFSPDTIFPGVVALIPCLGAAMVIYGGIKTDSLGGKLISWSPIQSIGNASYSIYLWHWPFLVFCRQFFGEELNAYKNAIAVGIVMALSFATYRFVERPIMRIKVESSSFIKFGFVTIAIFSVLGSQIFLAQGFPMRFWPQTLTMFDYANDFNKLRDKCHNDQPPVRDFGKNCAFGAALTPADVAVWGDSHGAELVVALGLRARGVGRSVLEITSSACPPSQGFRLDERPWCPLQNKVSLEGLRRDDHIKTVILITNAARYDNRSDLMKGYEETVRVLVAAHKHVISVLQIPTFDVIDPPEQIGMTISWGRNPENVGKSRSTFFDESSSWRQFNRALRGKYGIDILDPSDSLCDKTICHAFDRHAGVLYFNNDHLSVAGAAFMSKKLSDTLYGERAE